VVSTNPKFPEGNTYFIAYWVGEEYEGKGIVTRSVKALVDALFRLDWVETVVIYCAVENTRSQAIPRRLGFLQGAVTHNSELVRGKSFDEVEFSMTKAAWLTHKPPAEPNTP
jgi:ribosomal-protein-serine acetyltransferase